MKLLSKYLFDLLAGYCLRFKKLPYLLSVICIFSLISCAPSIETMKMSIDEFNSRADYYVSLNDVLKSESPKVLKDNQRIHSELNKEDKILSVEGMIKKTYFDVYQINNQYACEVKFEVASFPDALGPHGWQMRPKLYLFSEDNINNYSFNSKPPIRDNFIVTSEMICSLKENTIYYLLVCADVSRLMEKFYNHNFRVNFLSSSHMSSSQPFTKPFYITNEGAYILKYYKYEKQ